VKPLLQLLALVAVLVLAKRRAAREAAANPLGKFDDDLGE